MFSDAKKKKIQHAQRRGFPSTRALWILTIGITVIKQKPTFILAHLKFLVFVKPLEVKYNPNERLTMTVIS